MYDVIIIGGSYAGLAAALQLVRARRRVLILDAGQRRNRFAGHSHGFLGQDGQPPGAIAAKGKAEVLAYPTVTWKDALAAEAVRTPDGFVVRADGDEFRGKRLILATGVVDELPAVPGLEERWGKRVFFCPYCDGYEFGLGSLAVLATSPQSARFAILISEWAGPGQTTFFLNGQPEPDAHELAQLAASPSSASQSPASAETSVRSRCTFGTGASPSATVCSCSHAPVSRDRLPRSWAASWRRGRSAPSTRPTR